MSSDFGDQREYWLDHPLDDNDDDSSQDEVPRTTTSRNYANEMRHNNPRSEPVGHFTGRCARCGSRDLWDDNIHYGCNSCGAYLG